MKTNISEISEVKTEIEGRMRLERVVPWDYTRQRKEWLKEFGLVLPSRELLSGFGCPEELRLFLSTLTITVTCPDSSWYQWQFRPGFLTDLASVPGFFRGVVDNDGLRVLAAALPHDRLFSCHDLSFEDTNRLFHLILLQQKYPAWRARLAYWAVSSWVGRRRWAENENRRCAWSLATSSFDCSTRPH